jgi:5-methylcytosine-specific restriction endonuclease McrA
VTDNRTVICAGCTNTFFVRETSFYRNKRWCGALNCKDTIDTKVRHSNYKKTQKKIKNGTFRHGVDAELREYIKQRDNNTCKLCSTEYDFRNTQVHHIVPVSDGGSDEYENLILLCGICHVEVHQKGWELYVNNFKKYTVSTHTKI